MTIPAKRRRYRGPVQLIRMDMARCCHWVVGNERQGPKTLMCARPKAFADSYCEEHELQSRAAPRPRWSHERKARWVRGRHLKFVQVVRP